MNKDECSGEQMAIIEYFVTIYKENMNFLFVFFSAHCPISNERLSIDLSKSPQIFSATSILLDKKGFHDTSAFMT